MPSHSKLASTYSSRFQSEFGHNFPKLSLIIAKNKSPRMFYFSAYNRLKNNNGLLKKLIDGDIKEEDFLTLPLSCIQTNETKEKLQIKKDNEHKREDMFLVICEKCKEKKVEVSRVRKTSMGHKFEDIYKHTCLSCNHTYY